MSKITSENTFETAIIQSLLENDGYSHEVGIFNVVVTGKIKVTQEAKV